MTISIDRTGSFAIVGQFWCYDARSVALTNPRRGAGAGTSCISPARSMSGRGDEIDNCT